MVIKQLDALQWGFSRKLPTMLQAEVAECGIACIAMIASFHGHCIDLQTLRTRFPPSSKGATLAQVMQIASQLDMAGRPLRLEPDALPDLQAPCILHWDLNHFVVLKKATAKYVDIHDPAVGSRRLSYAEVSDHFTGVALELTPTPQFRKQTDTQHISLTTLIGTVVGLRRSVAQILILSLSLELVAVLAPLYQQWVVDNVIVTHDNDLLSVLTLGFFMLLAVQVVVTLLRSWMVIYFGTTLNLQWVANLFTRLLRLPTTYFERRQLADVVSRFNSIQSIRQTLTTTALDSLLDGLMASVALAMMLLYSVKLALVSIGALALYTLARVVSYGPFKDANHEQLVHSAKEQSHFLESIRGVQAIKLFGREDERRGQWLNLSVNTVNRSLASERMLALFRGANAIIFGVENLLIIYLGARMVMADQFSVGMMFAYMAYKLQFSDRVGKLVDLAFSIKMLRIQTERLADIVLTEPEPFFDVQGHTGQVEPSIELRNVRFRYSDAEPWVLDGVSFKIEAGESVVVVGPSGCGKTTLLKVMLSITQPVEGEVLVGGLPINGVGLRSYRSLLGAVMQEDQLFAGSVADNISFFAPNPDLERIHAAAAIAAIHDEIVAMPMGYQTLLGEMAVGLSGGQKQRILLARAIYKQPRILLLDEATSNLDVDRERAVNENVRSLALTRISIAHRPDTIAMASRVIRLDKGKVAQDFRQVPTGRGADASVPGM